MSKKEMEKEPVILTFNEREYKAEDLTDVQKDIAAKLNIAGTKLNDLQRAYNDYIITNDYKNIMVKAFEASLENKDNDTEEAIITEDNS